jgi:hypothetical protein
MPEVYEPKKVFTNPAIGTPNSGREIYHLRPVSASLDAGVAHLYSSSFLSRRAASRPLISAF